MKESHDNHLGERNTLERARKLGIWLGMDKEIIDHVKKCPTYQFQKTTRVKNKMESVIPDIPTKLHEKITFDIFGPLPEINKGNKYVLSIQFEEALKIKQIKTTAFHPQSNGNIERMHSTLLNLI